MRIRRYSAPSTEETEHKQTKKSSWLSLITLINALFLLLAILCWVGTCSRNIALNEYREGVVYQVQDDVVHLKLASGIDVELRFGENSVKIKEAYRVSTVKEQTQVILFIKSHLHRKDKRLTQTTTDCVGEYRLHYTLYHYGYEIEHTKDVDLEYASDPRWYVNVCSRLLGWTGI